MCYEYYCEFSTQTIDHVSPSIIMIDNEIQMHGQAVKRDYTILDLGCGYGRNSLYLGKKYNTTNVVLVDSDSNMLNCASRLLSLHGVPARTVSSTIEDLAGNPSRFYNEAGVTSPFDVVIISYVVQHLDPVYYPLVFDFCKSASKKYAALDVFRNVG